MTKDATLEVWTNLSESDVEELKSQVSGLPSELEGDKEEAKRFDYLMLKLQLAKLRGSSDFDRLKDQVIKICSLLEEKSSIPSVNAHITLIDDMQLDEWWQDVTIQMLETSRKKLRSLIQFIEKKERKIIYTDFKDEMGEEQEIILPAFDEEDVTGEFSVAGNLENFRKKAQAFLKTHENHIAIYKLKMNQPLTKSDLNELEKMLLDNAIGTKALIDKAKAESKGLGVFIRTLIGLDRAAAKEAFAVFLQGKTLNANQINFVNMVVDHLTSNGIMEIDALYESPFTDITPRGPEGVFTSEQVTHLISILNRVKETAIVA